jgi:dihydropyrimidinase
MAEFELLILNATLVTDSAITDCDIAIGSNGVIAKIDSRGSIDPASSIRVIDAEGAFVTPGGVDAHVHLDEPPLFGKGSTADNFETGQFLSKISTVE